MSLHALFFRTSIILAFLVNLLVLSCIRIVAPQAFSWTLAGIIAGSSTLLIVAIHRLLASRWLLPPLRSLRALADMSNKINAAAPPNTPIRELARLLDLRREECAANASLERDGRNFLEQGDAQIFAHDRKPDGVSRILSQYALLLRQLQQYLDEIVQGHLYADIPVELHQTFLYAPLHDMTTLFRTLLDNIGLEAKQISAASADVAAKAQQTRRNAAIETETIEQISLASEQVTGNLSDVMTDIHCQAESLEQTFAAIDRMAHSIASLNGGLEAVASSSEATSRSIADIHKFMQDIDEHAHELARISETISSEAQEGGHSVAEVIEGISAIKRTVQEASAAIDRLGKASEQIGEILAVINGIAEQTNLLALNASIIAAQAGEHGRGFSVVAGEIRDLAERTRKSTKEIAAIIRTLQREVAGGSVSMKSCLVAVDDGVKLANHSERMLDTIRHSIQQASQMAATLVGATAEQTRNSEQVNTATDHISRKLEELFEAATNQASDSARLAQTARVLKEVTQHITDTANVQFHETEQIATAITSMRSFLHRNASIAVQLADSAQNLGELESLIAEYLGPMMIALPTFPPNFDPARPTIAFVCANAPFFFSHVYEGVCKQAAQQGYQTMMLNAEDSRVLQAQHVPWFIRQPYAKGIVIVPIDEYVGRRVIDQCLSSSFPVVVVDRPTENALLSIVSDNELGGEIAADLLKERLAPGDTVICCGYRSISCVFNRMEGFFRKARQYQWNVVELFSSALDVKLAKANIEEGLNITADAKGIFMTNEDASLGYLELLRERKIPQGISAVCYDFTPSIAQAILNGEAVGTIYQNPEELGSRAVQELFRLTQQPDVNLTALPVEKKVPVQPITSRNVKEFIAKFGW